MSRRAPAVKKKPKRLGLGFWVKSLAIPYFRMANCHTIIGAKRFHCRVRDGIGWFTLAMVTKQTGVKAGSRGQAKGVCKLLTFTLALPVRCLCPGFRVRPPRGFGCQLCTGPAICVSFRLAPLVLGPFLEICNTLALALSSG